MKKHEHIQAALMYEIEKKLEEIQRRGVGYIDLTYTGGIDYKIDDIVYEIKITERRGDDGQHCKDEERNFGLYSQYAQNGG